MSIKMVAGKLANMRQGSRTDLEHSANLHEVSSAEDAKKLNVSERSVKSAKVVQNGGSANLPTQSDDKWQPIGTLANIIVGRLTK